MINYTFKSSYIRYIFGAPIYSDEYLNEIGEKYGVTFHNLGFTIDTNLAKHNQIINRVLAKRNGKDWQKQFWKEVEQNKTKSSSYVPTVPDSEIDLK